MLTLRALIRNFTIAALFVIAILPFSVDHENTKKLLLSWKALPKIRNGRDTLLWKYYTTALAFARFTDR